MTWKPLPGTSDPHGPRRLEVSLDRVARSLNAPGANVLASIFTHWSTIVGADAAAHSWPLTLAGGVLSVGVDQPGWATQMTYLEADLRRRVTEVTGADVVRHVRVSVRSARPPNW